MLIPFGANVGKLGGAMIFILINKLQQSREADDGKVTYDNFNSQAIILTNKIFLAQFIHFVDFNNINVRV